MLRSHDEWNRIDYDALAEAVDREDEVEEYDEIATTANHDDAETSDGVAQGKAKPRSVETAILSVVDSQFEAESSVNKGERMSKWEKKKKAMEYDKFDEKSSKQVKSSSELLEAKAAVARLKSKKPSLRAKKMGRSELEAEKEKREHEARKAEEAAQRMRQLSDRIEKIVHNREEGAIALEQGRLEQSVEAFLNVLEDVKSVEPYLPKREAQETKPRQCEGGCNHGHAHAHGHHSKQETGSKMSEDMGETFVPSKLGKSLGIVVDRSKRKTLILLGKAYTKQRKYVLAVDTFRELLLVDRSIEEAWILRAEAFIRMGAPLLAEVHLNQKQVDSSSARVKKLKETIQQLVLVRHDRTMSENLDEAERCEGIKENTPLEDMLNICHRLRQEGEVLHAEQFFYSCMIKYGLLLRLADRCAGLAIHGEDKVRIAKLQLESLLSLSSCIIHRQVNYHDALLFCSRALQIVPFGVEHPRALILRAQAYKALGQYSFALENLSRAQRSCRMILSGSMNCTPNMLIQGASELEGTVKHPRKLLDKVEAEIRQVKFLWKQVGQLTLPRLIPPLAIRVHSNTAWPSKKEWAMLKVRPSDRVGPCCNAEYRKPNMLVLVVPGRESDLEELLSEAERQWSIKFQQHRSPVPGRIASLYCLMYGTLPSLNESPKSIVEAMESEGYSARGFGPYYTAFAHEKKLSTDEDSCSEATEWIREHATGNTRFFAFLALSTLENANSNIKPVLESVRGISRESLILLTSMDEDSGPIPLIMCSSELFSRTPDSKVLEDENGFVPRYGMKVQCRNAETGEWFDAIITKVNNDEGEKFDVVYCFGDSENNVPKQRIRQVESKDQHELLFQHSNAAPARPPILTTPLDVLPTLLHLAKASNIPADLLGRNLGLCLRRQVSTQLMCERGNFHHIVSRDQETILESNGRAFQDGKGLALEHLLTVRASIWPKEEILNACHELETKTQSYISQITRNPSSMGKPVIGQAALLLGILIIILALFS